MTDRYINPWRLFHGAFVPNWLMQLDDLTAGAKLVYARLTQYAGKTGIAYPTRDELAEKVGMSVRQVGRYLDELRSYGLIEVERKGLQKANRYRFLRHPAMGLTDQNGTSREDTYVPSGEDTYVPSGEDTCVPSGEDTYVPSSIKKRINRRESIEENQDPLVPPRGRAREVTETVTEWETARVLALSYGEFYRLYELNISPNVAHNVAEHMQEWVAERIPPERGLEVVRYVIDEAVSLNKRSWRYLERTLERLEREQWPSPLHQDRRKDADSNPDSPFAGIGTVVVAQEN